MQLHTIFHDIPSEVIGISIVFDDELLPHAFYTLSQCCSSPIRPYLEIVFMNCSMSCGPSFFRTNFPIEIQSRISPPFFHTLAAIYLARLELSLDSTFSDTSKNFSSVYLGRKSPPRQPRILRIL
jgi:hypothetical protein